MLKMKIVHIEVELRPQYGTGSRFFIGIFDDPCIMDNAISNAKAKYNNYQHYIEIDDVFINKNMLSTS